MYVGSKGWLGALRDAARCWPRAVCSVGRGTGSPPWGGILCPRDSPGVAELPLALQRRDGSGDRNVLAGTCLCAELYDGWVQAGDGSLTGAAFAENNPSSSVDRAAD